MYGFNAGNATSHVQSNANHTVSYIYVVPIAVKWQEESLPLAAPQVDMTI
jgi:hypothetical protein